MKEAVPMYKIPITPENLGGRKEVSGEIHQKNKKESENKEPKADFGGKVERTINSFSAYIARMAKERGGELPVAEAASIYSNDLLPGLRAKSFSEGEEKEMVEKMAGTGFYDTEKTLIIPTKEGEATFNLVAVIKDGKPKLTLEPGAYSDIARRISGS